MDDIRCEGRYRRDMGDIEGLARSMMEVGLLHPVVVTPSLRLIAGERRILAARMLGWDTIPVHVVDLGQVVRGEWAENAERKDFTPSEAVAIGRALEPAEREAAKERQESTRFGAESFSTPDGGRARDKVAAAVGMSRPTYAKAAAVVDAAEREPERYGDVLERMDATSNVSAAYRELAARQREAEKVRAEAERAQREGNAALIWHKSAAEFLEEMGWLSADLLLTDPPYSTDLPAGCADVGEFIESWLYLALRAIKPTGRGYLCVGAYPEELREYIEASQTICKGLPVSLEQILPWTYRNTLGPAPLQRYKQNWQAVLYYVGREAPPLDCPLMVEQFSVQDVNAPDGRLGDRYHAWQKPDELAERFVRHSTLPGQVVIDPFVGTGTFILAASRLGRKGMGCEISEEMIQIAVGRGCCRAE